MKSQSNSIARKNRTAKFRIRAYPTPCRPSAASPHFAPQKNQSAKQQPSQEEHWIDELVRCGTEVPVSPPGEHQVHRMARANFSTRLTILARIRHFRARIVTSAIYASQSRTKNLQVFQNFCKSCNFCKRARDLPVTVAPSTPRRNTSRLRGLK